jgi:hypothetical protein
LGAKSVSKNLAISLLQSLALGPLGGIGGGAFGGQSQTAIVSEDLPSLDDELPVQVLCTAHSCIYAWRTETALPGFVCR